MVIKMNVKRVVLVVVIILFLLVFIDIFRISTNQNRIKPIIMLCEVNNDNKFEYYGIGYSFKYYDIANSFGDGAIFNFMYMFPIWVCERQ